jgi:mRNA interferase MazF
MKSGEVDYIPDRGDIVFINFSPQKGHEQGFKRPAIVLTPLAYNKKTSLAILCPITSQIKGYPFEVPLIEGLKTTGVVIADHIKSLDWKARGAKFLEHAPAELLDEVLAKIEALILI